jgi:hypothetical protein
MEFSVWNKVVVHGQFGGLDSNADWTVGRAGVTCASGPYKRILSQD